MTMPFGKYKGRELDTIPVDYLEWVLENVDLRSLVLRDAIEQVVYGPELRKFRIVGRDDDED